MNGIPTPTVDIQWASDAPDAPDEPHLCEWAVSYTHLTLPTNREV